MKILVTGGAGFIGSFLVDALIDLGHTVRVFDNLEQQVHRGNMPKYFNTHAEFIQGDICNSDALDKSLRSIDVVFHEAAMVGVGQSMYQIVKYTRVNELGTATLLDLLVNKHRHHIQKLIVAASMSEYGEGLSRCLECGTIKPPLRSEKDLEKKEWELRCPNCRSVLKPLPTPEDTPLSCNSIYAINKKVQEESVLTVGKAFAIPTVALRYFNVYGPRQSLSNPYTGVAAIFISRMKADKPCVVYEDGLQSRDFVSVHDVVSANIAAMKSRKADYQVFNVGSGKSISILSLVQVLSAIFGKHIPARVARIYRKGDIRHCVADISKIQSFLHWKPATSFSKGMEELVDWSHSVQSDDLFDQAHMILKQKGVL